MAIGSKGFSDSSIRKEEWHVLTPSFHYLDWGPEVVTGTKIGVLLFDAPGEKVNQLGEKVIQEFEEVLGVLESKIRKKTMEIIILASGKPQQFVAGADLRMLESVSNASQGEALSLKGNALLSRWEDLEVPTIAFIEGPALGGGLELALASTYRVAIDAKAVLIGLPETQLGVIPGSGGCFRLASCVGLQAALDCILSGKQLRASKAKKLGILDGLIRQEDGLPGFLKWVETHAAKLKKRVPFPKSETAFLDRPFFAPLIRRMAQKEVEKKTKGHYPAPLRALEVVTTTYRGKGVWLRGSLRSLAEKKEAANFGEMAAHPVSKYLIRLFFLSEAQKKGPQPHKVVRSIGVVGGGVMGGGIVEVALKKGFSVRLVEPQQQSLTKTIERMTKAWKKDLQKGRMEARDIDQRLARLQTESSALALKQDLWIEAVPESLSIKIPLLQSLQTDTGILATNTSSLSVTRMSSELKDPSRFIGIHFFNPVPKMPLVEVIPHETTSEQTLQAALHWVRALGKVPIKVKDVPGFFVNRILSAYFEGAMLLFKSRVLPLQVDAKLTEWGMPVGPFALMDEVGLDVSVKVAKSMIEGYPGRFLDSAELGLLAAAGRLGKKSGAGFLKYTLNAREPVWDDSVFDLCQVRAGMPPKTDIVKALIVPMILEAGRCVLEGVVESKDVCDLGLIFGTGFPPFRGGPMVFAKEMQKAWFQEGLGTIPDLAPELYGVTPELETLLF